MDNRTEKRKAFIINTLYYGIVILLVLFACKYVLGWLMPFIIGFVIALIFNPLITRLSRRIKINRSAIACIVVIIGYGVIAVLLTFLVIQVVTVLQATFSQLPTYYSDYILPAFENLNTFLSDFLKSFPPEWQTQLSAIQDSILGTLQSAIMNLSSRGISALTSFSGRLPGFFVGFAFTILSSFFISMQYQSVTRFIMRQIPRKARALVIDIKNLLYGSVAKYLTAYVKLMGITFVELLIGFLIIGIPSAPAAALGIALFDFLPVFGTGGIMIPWIIIEIFRMDFGRALALAILYAIITVIRNFVEPKIVGDQLGLNPLVSIIAIYIGYVWMGFAGMIVMPIIVQIALTLHKEGKIRLYKEPPAREKTPGGSADPPAADSTDAAEK
ncbi:sporulation integral membrane protein YtvI [Oscillospiraceae bacterium OttesenSCG-928-F05]|nr:sporulation integral membrane protein YtvI [Oscillospiraceae bacterium OttesenSCG-928-F05]